MTQVVTHVTFHFDPLCPWCYQTSRWVRRLVELGEVEADWAVFSLALANATSEEGREKSARKDHARGAPALRTVMAVRDAAGDSGVGRYYEQVGRAIHEDGRAADDEGAIRDTLRAADLDPALLDTAMADETTWDRVEAEHHALVDETRSFGVPTIVVHADDRGPEGTIFGPVITDVPGDEDAVELFRHVAWLARYENFSELKRDRSRRPDLESVRQFQARMAERDEDPDMT